MNPTVEIEHIVWNVLENEKKIIGVNNISSTFGMKMTTMKFDGQTDKFLWFL